MGSLLQSPYSSPGAGSEPGGEETDAELSVGIPIVGILIVEILPRVRHDHRTASSKKPLLRTNRRSVRATTPLARRKPLALRTLHHSFPSRRLPPELRQEA